MLLDSDTDQLKLGMNQIHATGGIGMEKLCHKSIVALHECCNQERVCKVGGQDGEGEINEQIIWGKMSRL